MKKDEIAQILEQNIDGIVENWAQEVRRSNVKSSEDLSEGGLRDHVPQVLEEIAALLRSDGAPDINNTRDARVAAYTRYTQNYRIGELITEIALLRLIIFNRLGEICGHSNTSADLSEFVRATATINSYLDEEMRYGSSIFCESILKMRS